METEAGVQFLFIYLERQSKPKRQRNNTIGKERWRNGIGEKNEKMERKRQTEIDRRTKALPETQTHEDTERHPF